MKIRNSQNYPTSAEVKQHFINLEEDQIERSRVIATLTNAIKEKLDGDTIDYSHLAFTVRLDSSFDQVKKVTGDLLNDFLELQHVRNLLVRKGIKASQDLVVTQDGRAKVN